MPFATVSETPEVKLYYHVYGQGPHHVLLIGGLGGLAHHWDVVAQDLVQDHDFSVCVFDNRGVGLSTVTPGRYTTKLLAQDASALLDHLNWKTVHIVGLSLGGMIAQELAVMLGPRVVSLTLESTYAKFSGITLTMLKIVVFGPGVVTPDVESHCKFIPTVNFPADWLSQPSKQDPSITNHHHITSYFLERYKKTGLQTPVGRNAQQLAAGLHYCDRRLNQIRDHSYPVLVIAGDNDHILVQPSSCAYLAKRLGARLEVYPNGGHLVFLQDTEWHNRILKEHLKNAIEQRSQQDQQQNPTSS